MATLSTGKTTPSAKAARQSVDHVARDFNTDPTKGLYTSDVHSLRALYGSNELEAADEESLFSKFLDSFKDPLILLLLGSACISVLMGQFDDAISITMVTNSLMCITLPEINSHAPLYQIGHHHCSNR
jgi:Ca2+-transporting ATPase